METFLKAHDKRYVMLSAFGVPIETTETFTNYLGWPNENMQTWTWNADCAKGPRGHFLEQGHEIVADKIYEYIRHLSWLP